VSKQPWDVLQERVFRSYDAKTFDGFGPHVARVVFALLLAGDAERLAWESSRDNINHALICFGETVPDETSYVSKDRGGVQKTVGDSLFNNFLAVVVIFHIAYVFPAKKRCSKYAAARSGK